MLMGKKNEIVNNEIMFGGGMPVGAIHNDRLMVKVCEMYYLLDMSQKEIAVRLGISRPQISRIIAQARENRYVEIKIANPYSDETALEQRLMADFHLKDALVVRTMGATSEERMTQFSKEAAVYVDTCLGTGQTVGVMSGTTVAAIVEGMHNSGKRIVAAVPLVGGIGSEQADLHANAIAMRLAREYGGTAMVLNAPLMVSGAETARMLREEESIRSVLDRGCTCDVSLVGIGNVEASSTTAQAGGLTAADLQTLRAAGAVSSVCNSYFDASGAEIDVLQERSIGQRLSDLRHSKVVACAIGLSKVAAIHSALLTGKLDMLLTDLETARALTGTAQEESR